MTNPETGYEKAHRQVEQIFRQFFPARGMVTREGHGNKIEAEQNDYNRLLQTGIRIPRMLDIDVANERILKEYIDGPTIYDLVKNDTMKDLYLVQMREMAKVVYDAGLNIDYFPTNFIVQDEKIFYIDYECNNYMDEWNFENWGIKYWSKTPEFIAYMEQH